MVWAYCLAACGIVLDLFDITTCFALPDSVVCKSLLNLFSCLLKWVAFGLLVGASTDSFTLELQTARCFNDQGMKTLADARRMYGAFILWEPISAVLNILVTPLSAYYGGKLQGMPYVK